jgi:tRNA C32,U32 (ribose-2'-O)-methylase TrmJ
MFEFNPKLLLFIPVTVVFYKLLSQKEEVNEKKKEEKKEYPYFENEKRFRDSLLLTYKPFERPKLPIRKKKTKKKLFKIMDDSIKDREVKKILYNMIEEVVKKSEIEMKKNKKIIKKEKKDISYLSYFNISKLIYHNEEKFEKVDLSSEGSYDRVSKMSDLSKMSEFSKISLTEFTKISEEK